MIRLLSGDCRDVLATLPAESVQCVVCSPPYYGLRDYGTALWDGGDAACDHTRPSTKVGNATTLRLDGREHVGLYDGEKATEPGYPFRDTCGKCGAVRVDRQIGLESDPETYLATMVGVFREIKRVLRKDGTAWVNLGSSYASGGKRASRSPLRERVPAYDSGGTEPSGLTVPDYAYSDLDDEPLDGFLSHRDRSPDTPLPPQLSSLHCESVNAHGSEPLASTREVPSLFDVLASTSLSSSQNAQDACGLGERVSAGLSDGQTLPDAGHQSGDSLASPFASRSSSAVSQDQPPSTLYTVETDGSSASRTEGRGAGSISCNCGSCGICFAYSAIPMLQFKAKDLMMMPELFALALQADGWYIRSSIIWHKPNPMPESVSDRPTSAYEMVYLLTRSSRYYYDNDAVRERQDEPWRSTGRIEDMGSKDVLAGINGGFGLDGQRPREYNPAGRNLRNVWTIATHAYPAAHFATFPPELAERCIKAGTSERGACAQCGKPWGRVTERGDLVPTDKTYNKRAYGPREGYDSNDLGSARAARGHRARMAYENTTTGWSPGCDHDAACVPCTVLDPFAGAGTTLLVADRLQRDAIGIELNTAYTEMAMERCRADAPLFTSFPPAEPPEDMRMADLFTDMAAD